MEGAELQGRALQLARYPAKHLTKALPGPRHSKPKHAMPLTEHRLPFHQAKLHSRTLIINNLSCFTGSDLAVFNMCTDLFIQRSSAKVVNLPAALQGSKAPSLSDLEEQLLLTSSPLSRSFSSPLPLALFPLYFVCALRP